MHYIKRPNIYTRSLAIADLIWYSVGEKAGLPDVAFVGADKFSEIYIILHYSIAYVQVYTCICLYLYMHHCTSIVTCRPTSVNACIHAYKYI